MLPIVNCRVVSALRNSTHVGMSDTHRCTPFHQSNSPASHPPTSAHCYSINDFATGAAFHIAQPLNTKELRHFKPQNVDLHTVNLQDTPSCDAKNTNQAKYKPVLLASIQQTAKYGQYKVLISCIQWEQEAQDSYTWGQHPESMPFEIRI